MTAEKWPILYIYYGSLREASEWALENEVVWSQVVLASRPHQLQGRRGRPKEIFGQMWTSTMIENTQRNLSDAISEMERLYGKADPEVKESPIPEGFEPGRWWKATNADGSFQAETTDPEDFETLGVMDVPGITIYREFVKTEARWVVQDPRSSDA